MPDDIVVTVEGDTPPVETPPVVVVVPEVETPPETPDMGALLAEVVRTNKELIEAVASTNSRVDSLAGIVSDLQSAIVVATIEEEEEEEEAPPLETPPEEVAIVETPPEGETPVVAVVTEIPPEPRSEKKRGYFI